MWYILRRHLMSERANKRYLQVGLGIVGEGCKSLPHL